MGSPLGTTFMSCGPGWVGLFGNSNYLGVIHDPLTPQTLVSHPAISQAH